jgi:phosphoglycolate phosphatase
MPRLQGMIFDLDGTLLDSAPDIRQALNLMLAQHGRRPLTLEETKQALGDGVLMSVRRSFAMTGNIPETDLFPFVQQYITHYRNIKADPAQIYPHVVPLLERYGQAGVRLGICTNKAESSTYHLLKDLDLLRHFAFVAGGDTFRAHKPHPDHVYGVIAALDVPREGCVMVGDSVNDVAAAHGAGIPCIIITQGYGDDAESLKADRFIGHCGELPEALAALGFS